MDNYSFGRENLAAKRSLISWRIMYAAVIYSSRIKKQTLSISWSDKGTIVDYKKLQQLVGFITDLKLMKTSRRGERNRFIESKTSVHKRKEDDS